MCYWFPIWLSKNKNGKTFVKVLKENNQVEQRSVEVGVQNDIQSEVKSGLQEGEKVIVSQVVAGEQVGNSMRGPRMF